VLIGLVNVALRWRARYFPDDEAELSGISNCAVPAGIESARSHDSGG
jgi:hypothetical protein